MISMTFITWTTCGIGFFFFNDTATTESYTLSLHDALPISLLAVEVWRRRDVLLFVWPSASEERDRKSTRLNSSHTVISYAVFCLKKKKNLKKTYRYNINLPRHQLGHTDTTIQ